MNSSNWDDKIKCQSLPQENFQNNIYQRKICDSKCLHCNFTNRLQQVADGTQDGTPNEPVLGHSSSMANFLAGGGKHVCNETPLVGPSFNLNHSLDIFRDMICSKTFQNTRNFENTKYNHDIVNPVSEFITKSLCNSIGIHGIPRLKMEVQNIPTNQTNCELNPNSTNWSITTDNEASFFCNGKHEHASDIKLEKDTFSDFASEYFYYNSKPNESPTSVSNNRESKKSETKNSNIASSTLDSNAMKCTQCSYSTTNKYRFKNHQLEHVIDDLKCPECSYTTKNKYRFKYHLEQHNSHFRCTECSFTTKDKYRFKYHTMEHRNGVLKCTECSFTSKDKYRFKYHTLEHSSEEQKCSECSFTTRNKYKFKHHLRKHKKPSI